jgi:hypothetical protein
MNDLVIGKEGILDYCRNKFNLHSWQSVRNWKRKYKFPIRYLPNRKPFLVIKELIEWSVKYDELRKSD